MFKFVSVLKILRSLSRLVSQWCCDDDSTKKLQKFWIKIWFPSIIFSLLSLHIIKLGLFVWFESVFIARIRSIGTKWEREKGYPSQTVMNNNISNNNNWIKFVLEIAFKTILYLATFCPCHRICTPFFNANESK